MRILLASSEVHPFSKTGGLADMVGALAKALARMGHRIGVVTPLWKGIREAYPKLQRFDWQMDLPLGQRRVQAEVWTLTLSRSLVYYFIHQPEFYQRADLYQENGVDYPDNAERFIFFAKAVTHLARYLPWRPELVHAHDWQAGLAPLLVFHQHWREGWGEAPRTCLTVHNLAFQGNFPVDQYRLTNLPWDYFHPQGVEFYGGMSCLKAGIVYADVLNTVSPTYAREITTPELGCGLDGVLRQRQHVLTGILNGADYGEWKTTRNPFLRHWYSLRRLRGKKLEKLALQQQMDLHVAADLPLFGNIGRLSEQKGIPILLSALEEMLASRMQFVELGRGAAEFEEAFVDLAKRYPSQVAVKIGYDEGLPHRIEAGCDFYVMPSRFEPCGLNQIYSLRYGAIPIVRATGGLDDSVVDIAEAPEKANGIKFAEYSARALAKAMRKALVLYQVPLLLKHYRHNAMQADFSWEKSAAEYVKLYQKARRH
jgi:starch synthase